MDALMVLAILVLLAIAVLFSVRGIRAESRANLCAETAAIVLSEPCP